MQRLRFAVFTIVALSVLPLRIDAAQPLAKSRESKSSRPVIVAHRGMLRHAPENTLANFRACLELRLGFELDVLRSKDGKLVCVHDATVNRTTNGTGAVTNLTLAQLKQLDAGTWFDADFANERIPTIAEVFDLAARYDSPTVLIAVDLKGDDDKIERDVVGLARQSGVLDRLLFIGRAISDSGVRRRLRQADVKSHVASLANTPDQLVAALDDADADWVYVRYVPKADAIANVHALNKRVFIAGTTVASLQRKNWAQAAKVGIDAILTDYPLQLRLSRSSPKTSK